MLSVKTKYLHGQADWHTMKQAVMIGAGVRTSAESWELNVCVLPLSCMWQADGVHIYETVALI